MSTEPVLQISNLTKKIGRKKIVDRVSFEVPQGEVFGLLGPNGAGKTTIIRMIVGLMSLTDGEISINGNSIRSNFEEAIRQVGAIVENPELYKFLSGYQNLIHYARMGKGITKQRIDEVISLVKLDHSILDPVKTYSLGMRQRLGVAQAILHKPSLLILDEPTNGLDPAGIRELRDYLRHLAKEEGTTVMVSSHLLSEMELMCDRIAVIQQGQLMDVKPVHEMVQIGRDDVRLVQFHVDQPHQVQDILTKLGWNMKATPRQDGFEIILTKDQISELNAQLVHKGISVYEIRSQGTSLEDRFLEMTRG